MSKMVETGKVELNLRVPNLLPGNAKLIVRDLRHVLENCGRLHLLNDFIEMRTVEYEPVSMEAAK